MARKLEVMLSSTSFDLPEHRRLAIDAILRAGCVPVAMEHGTAAGVSAIPYSIRMVDQADVYIGIFGGRYGTVIDDERVNPQKWSVTEHEYRRGMARGIAVRIYLMSDKHPVSLKDVDEDRTPLKKLRGELEKKHVAAFFDSPEQLAARIFQSLTELEAPEAVDKETVVLPKPPELYAVPAYTLTNEFVGRKKELEELDLWAGSSDTVCVVEAIGGMGKSALTWEWVQRTGSFEGRIWYSMYESTASMQTFLRHALTYINREPPEKGADAYEMAGELLVLLQARPHLIVLDGFERILAAYHQKKDDLRQCVNPKDGDLIRKLVACGRSKILISSRLMPGALEDDKSRKPIVGVRHRNLGGLLPGDALDLARATGVKGSGDAILKFGEKFGYHALLMRIVCGLVNGDREAPGDFDKWVGDPKSGGYLAGLTGEHRNHILKFAFEGLEERQRLLLSRIAAMDDAAEYSTVKALSTFEEPAELNKALGNLEDRGLLQWDRGANTYDMHPVVRAYAVEQLAEQDRVGTYEAIRDHFAALPPEDLGAATELAHLRNSVQIFRALVGAGRLKEAAEFYPGDLSRALLFSVCAYGTVCELVRILLERAGPKPIETLGASLWGYVTNGLAIALGSLGDEQGARDLLGEKLRVDLAEKDWGNVSVGICSYSLAWGMAAGERAWRISLDLSAVVGDADGEASTTLWLAGDEVFRGRSAEARTLLARFREFPTPERASYRPGFAERVEATLVFYEGQLTSKILEDGEAVARKAHSTAELLAFPKLRAEWELTRGNPRAALESAERAIEMLRKSGERDSGPFAMRGLALARLGRPGEARQSLQEGSGEMVYSFYAAQAYVALGELEWAREAALEAYRLAWDDGPPYSYHWYLEGCRGILRELGVPEPVLAPFDPAKVEKIPYEEEILAAIEKLRGEKKEGGL